MSSGEQLTVALVALYIVKQLIEWLFSFTRGQQKQDAVDKAERARQEAVEAAERGRWMSMLETILEKEHGKFSELASTFKDGLDNTVLTMQSNFTAALEQTIARMEDRMTPVTAARIAKENLMHEDIKTIPSETLRLLGQEFVKQTETVRLAVETASKSHQEVIREAVTSALKPMLEQIEGKLDQMPGADVSRQMIRDEVGSLQQQLVEQVAVQISPLFDKLSEIAATLDKLQPPKKETEAGEQSPVDSLIRGENDHVGNPS